jgi:hypothetical protein
MIIFISIIAIFLGLRPDSDVFVDSTGYIAFYHREVIINTRGEWLWYAFEIFCQDLKLSDSAWLTFVSVFTFGFTFWGIHRLFPRKEWIALLLVLSNFTFYGGAVNGLRSGLAASFMILAISFLVENNNNNNNNKLIGVVIAVCSVSVHKSFYLPFICFLFCLLSRIGVKNAMKFYVCSIIISLIGGNSVSNLFLGLGFDDRMDSYIGKEASNMIYNNTFSHTGFRWDFLLFSVVPIVLGYYAVVIKKVKDKYYTLLINTYILANAFWVMVIRSSFSNRFASLSWFLYGIVIAYPLLNFKLYRNQNAVISFFLLGMIAFSYILMLK